MSWTAANIPDLTGRVAVVTGANGGLGFETSLELVRHGAHVVMACRDERKGAQAVEGVQEEAPDSTVELQILDLASLTSVRSCAARLLVDHGRVDLLVNSAAVMAVPDRRTTEDGFEMHFGINHLGHFALTNLLLPALAASEGRVVTLTSTAYRMAHLRFDDLQAERRYRKWSAYGQSKLANLLFALELHRRSQAVGSKLVSSAVHPGLADTPLQDGTPMSHFRRFMRPAPKAARQILHAATSPDVAGGELFGPPGLLSPRRPRRMRLSRAGRDVKASERLWQVSEALTDVRYEFEMPVLSS